MDQASAFNQGLNCHCYELLGSRQATGPGEKPGWQFAVWAPNAAAVSVTGSFNDWDDPGVPLQLKVETGIWSGFVYGASQWDRYKYLIRSATGQTLMKADPFARHSEIRPGTASVLYEAEDFKWTDADWLKKRQQDMNAGPLNIYEVHLGSWRRHEDGGFMNYREIAILLGAYLVDMSYTAVEFMPIMEHPLDDSWGYQITGYYSVTSRFGTPADFKYLVNHLHGLGIRVILDWVPAHFPQDDFGLACFDGTALFECGDSRYAEYPEWGTYAFAFERPQVRSFLLSNAFFWLEEFHVDGLRVDAVASMLGCDYNHNIQWNSLESAAEHASLNGVDTNGNRGANQHYKGNNDSQINQNAENFLRELNERIQARHPDVLMIAEDSSAFPQVTHPVAEGGSGFTHKWNMGWMSDTLSYFGRDYEERKWHHNQLSFSLMYAFSERYVLPFSHDEVVHGKGSLIERMPGDYWRKFASLRALYLYQITHPGAKLMFMGCEFGQFIEWRFYEQLEWFLLGFDAHRLLQDYVRQLNETYACNPSLYEQDDSWSGFSWHNSSDAENSVFVYSRWAKDGDGTVVVLNLTPTPRPGYRIGLPWSEPVKIILNSDKMSFGGSGYPTGASDDGILVPTAEPRDGQPATLTLDLPPLMGLLLQRARTSEK
jgi:1,4-alpha-glucan branching enzyme